MGTQVDGSKRKALAVTEKSKKNRVGSVVMFQLSSVQGGSSGRRPPPPLGLWRTPPPPCLSQSCKMSDSRVTVTKRQTELNK